jgi:dTDP-4-dehydrorhamnose 3,5-epimerase
MVPRLISWTVICNQLISNAYISQLSTPIDLLNRRAIVTNPRVIFSFEDIEYLLKVAIEKMKISHSEIPDVLIIEPQVFEDQRGFFMETYQAQKFAEVGIKHSFVQDNHSRSKQGTLRGLHYQIRHVQGKLVRVISGEIYDVSVDLHRSSPTFGKWVGVYLSAQNKRQVWVPPGFAHGFYVVSEWAEVLYKATDFYDPRAERTILWNDPTLNIQWPLTQDQPPTLSPKDLAGKLIKEAEVFD